MRDTIERLLSRKFLGASLWSGYFVFHIAIATLVIIGSISIFQDWESRFKYGVLGMFIVGLSVTELTDFMPKLRSIAHSIVILSGFLYIVDVPYLSIYSKGAEVIASGASSALDEAQTQMAGFNQSDTATKQTKVKPANNKSWWDYAKDKGYVSTGKRMTQAQLDWAGARQNNEHNRVNFETKTIQKCVSCTRGASTDMGYFN